MKNDNKNKWVENVFDSMKGSKRATPSPGLFAKIQGRIDAPEAKIIPMGQQRFAVAAAILVLVMNVFALRQVSQNNKSDNFEMVVVSSDVSSQSLISNYKIYE